MASIDKTYTKHYSEFLVFKEWAKEFDETFLDKTIMISDYLYRDIDESWFNGKEIPICNTTSQVDYYLIKYCPIEFVINRLKDVYNYGECDDDFFTDVKNGVSNFDTYKRVGGSKTAKLKITYNSDFKYQKLLRYKPKGKNVNEYHIGLVCYENGDYTDGMSWNYDYDKKVWFNRNELKDSDMYSSHCTNSGCKSLKAVIRKIRKWDLPKGLKFKIQGRYKLEDYTIEIK